MRKLFIVFAIVFQLAMLSWMALSREYVLQTGQQVKFQTAPIDPRDLFRGDFVRLDYAISAVSTAQLSPQVNRENLKKGDTLFAVLNLSQNGVATLASLQTSEPDNNKLFIRGRVTSLQNTSSSAEKIIRLKYGIEQYFVEQGKGLEIENKRGRRNTLQVPMLMHVALSPNGTAILKGHEWSAMGIGLSVLQQPETDALPEAASAILKLVLKNVGDKTIQLPFKPGNCSFSLISVATAPESIRLKAAQCRQASATVRQILPQQSLEFVFDLNDPSWRVVYKKKITPLGKLPWNYRFRIIYDEVDEADYAGIELISRAFHGRGQVD